MKAVKTEQSVTQPSEGSTLTHGTAWVGLEDTMLSGIRRTQEDRHGPTHRVPGVSFRDRK